jgi:putative chitinase
MMSGINRPFFFAQVRKLLFSNSLKQSQVNGLTAILDAWEKQYAREDDRWLAYALATTYHETDQKIKPIEEYGKGRGKPYGKPNPERGKIYYGRGFVQLTWKRNYEVMGNKINVDLVSHPELALELGNATNILFIGMTQGLFTGKSLKDYFNEKADNWVGARRIINDQDKEQSIAVFGHNFYSAISYTR